nr:palindromic element RPE1 domain-containing protein [Rickettsia australis]
MRRTKLYHKNNFFKQCQVLCYLNYFLIIKNNIEWNRLLTKFSYREAFEGDTEALATEVYTLVREDASLGSTYKLPLEVECCKKSNKKVLNYGICIINFQYYSDFSDNTNG